MKKTLLVFTMVVAIAVFFVGCGKEVIPSDTSDEESSSDTDTSDEESSSDTTSVGEVKDLADLVEAQQKIAENYDENDPEAIAKMMESYAELEGQMALQEFEKTEAVDAPSDFPSSLIFDKGKITSSSDNSDESYISKDIDIETTEDLKTVKDYYKNLFSELTWDLTSQSSGSDEASYYATDSANIEAGVYIYADTYSKIVTISISYSGSITE